MDSSTTPRMNESSGYFITRDRGSRRYCVKSWQKLTEITSSTEVEATFDSFQEAQEFINSRSS